MEFVRETLQSVWSFWTRLLESEKEEEETTELNVDSFWSFWTRLLESEKEVEETIELNVDSFWSFWTRLLESEKEVEETIELNVDSSTPRIPPEVSSSSTSPESSSLEDSFAEEPESGKKQVFKWKTTSDTEVLSEENIDLAFFELKARLAPQYFKHFRPDPLKTIVKGIKRRCSDAKSSVVGHKRPTVLIVPRMGRGRITVLRDTIGKGSYAKVKMGIFTYEDEEGHATSHEKVAIKIISHKKMKKKAAKTTTGILETIKREVTALHRSQHENVTKLRFVFYHSNKTYIGMECAQNGNLHEYLLENGALSEQQTKTWFGQIVNALDRCHSMGVVHYDIKPHNILITNNYKKVLLNDFGPSSVTDSSEDFDDDDFLSLKRRGTLLYEPPEMILHERAYDSRKNDIWSLGVVLYVMLTLRFPFSKGAIKHMRETLAKESYAGEFRRSLVYEPYMKPPKFKQGFPEGARKLILKMLNLNPDQRPSIRDIQQDPWLRQQPPEPAQNRLQNWFERITKF